MSAATTPAPGAHNGLWQSWEARAFGLVFGTERALRLPRGLLVSDMGTHLAQTDLGGASPWSSSVEHRVDCHNGYAVGERCLRALGYWPRESWRDAEGALVRRWVQAWTRAEYRRLVASELAQARGPAVRETAREGTEVRS